MKVYIVVAIILFILVFIDQGFAQNDFSVVEQNARNQCVAKRGVDQPPLSFRYDGCTLWPDGNWVECCAVHDATYWCGGSTDDRFQADVALGECVNTKNTIYRFCDVLWSPSCGDTMDSMASTMGLWLEIW